MAIKRANYAYDQVPGCAVAFYKNDGSNEKGIIYASIASARVERSVSDPNGAFNFTLISDQPWDEIIEAEDYVRIFMGDRITDSLATSTFDISKGKIAIPIDGSKKGQVIFSSNAINTTGVPWYGRETRQPNALFMYERMIGKIDTVRRSETQTETGLQTVFVVSGRSLASILQDTTLYYNENIPGLNAVNVFYGEKVFPYATPTEVVEKLIRIVMTCVPFPQWRIPKSLIADLDSSFMQENKKEAKVILDEYTRNLEQALKGNAKGDVMLTQMKKLIQETSVSSETSAANLFSFKGFAPTVGTNFNRSFFTAQAQTTGLMELVKSLTNSLFNEFWFDLCPGGQPNGGEANSSYNVPTFVMRQRPYDVTSTLTRTVTSYLVDPTDKIDKEFPATPIEFDGKNCSLSLENLLPSAFTVVAGTDTLQGFGREYVPTVLSYDVGRSGHERQNAFVVLPANGTPSLMQTMRTLSATAGGYKIDTESIMRYGMRMMEASTPYVQPPVNKSDQPPMPLTELMSKLSAIVANWYYLNPYFLSGSITCRFLPEARIGVPCRYVCTRKTKANPNGRIEYFYVQSVTDEYAIGSFLRTSLEVVRGLRYDSDPFGTKVSMISQNKYGGIA